jgi:hypothetical protein
MPDPSTSGATRATRNRGLCVLLAAGLTAANPGWGQAYNAEFDFRIAGIRAGVMGLTATQDGGSYRAEATVRPVGVVNVFSDFSFDGRAEGNVAADGTLVPDQFRSHSISPRDERETRIDWESGTPIFVSVVPPRSTAPDPAAQGGTLDPVSASLALFRDTPVAEVCRKSVDVFDGSRRSRISLGNPHVEGGDIICDGRYQRLEGEEQTFNTSSSYGFRMVFREDGDGMAQLQRVETRTQFGPASLVRK